jgi:hypothetical protein
MKHLSAIFIVCAALGLPIQEAQASTCSSEIARLEAALGGPANRNNAALTAPESLGAKLHHQPTPASVDRARQAAQSRVGQLLAQAEDLDASGQAGKCLEVVRAVKDITQTP